MMTILARVAATLMGAGLLVTLAGCDSGVIEVKAPQADAVVLQGTPVEFTATRHWSLTSVTVGSQDFTDKFAVKVGDAGAVSRAVLFLPPGRQTLTIAAKLGETGDSQGFHDAIKTQELVVDEEVLKVEGQHPGPSDDPDLFLSPVTVKVLATNVPWHGLQVTQSGDVTSSFSPTQGAANVAAVGTLVLGVGNHQATATVLDAAGFPLTKSATIHVVKDIAPDCPSPPSCTVPPADNLAAITSVPVGSTIADHCGKGTWAYTDGARSKCQAAGGSYVVFNPTPADNNTLCRSGFSRKFVSGKATCVAN